MKKKTTKKKTECCSTNNGCGGACGGIGYFVGFIGALVYYMATTTGFWASIGAILKALVWPAYLVYEVLKYVGA